MNISSEYPVRIYRKESEGNTYYNYSMGLSNKKQDGSYEYGYIKCRFRKGVTLENQTRIYLKEAWLSFYKKEDKTVPYIFINEFETVAEAIDNSKDIKKDEVEDPFKDFGEEVMLSDDDLPF